MLITMENKICPVENKNMIEFLKKLSKNRLEKIAKNLKIERYRNLSKDDLIQKIRDMFPDEIWITEIPQNSLTDFLVYLPDDLREFITTLAEGDQECEFGVWELEKIKRRYNEKVEGWMKTLENYGIVFKIKVEEKTYVVIPKDIWSGLVNAISYLKPPKNIKFEEFLIRYLTKEQLKHICRVYGLKISDTKRELAANIIGYGLTPKDVLSVMYFEDIVKLSEELNIYPLEEKTLKDTNRGVLIDDLDSHIIYESEDKKALKIIYPKQNIFKILVDLISHKFTPILKWNSDESDIEKQLVEYLSGFFECSDMDTNFISQYKLSSGGRIDIYDIENDVGVELKYNPSRANLRETVQRVKEYLEDVNRIIVAIFYREYSYSDTEILKRYESILGKIDGVTVIIREV